MILVTERRECFCHSGTVAAHMFSAGCWGTGGKNFWSL